VKVIIWMIYLQCLILVNAVMSIAVYGRFGPMLNVRIRRSDMIVSSEMRVGCGFKDMADQSDQSHEGSFLTVTS
jgi:hypothetical protein